MNCELYLELMSAAIDGECTAEERRTLDEHLAVCPECAALYEQLCRSAQAARELDCEVPAHLKARIMANLPPQETARQGKVIRWKRWVPVAAAACVVLVVSLLPKPMNTSDNAMVNVNTGTAVYTGSVEYVATAENAPQASCSLDAAESYGAVPDSAKAGYAAGSNASTDNAADNAPAASEAPAENSDGGYNYGDPGSAVSTAPENSGTGTDTGSGDTAGTNANSSQTGEKDVNIQTGENLEPGLMPGQGNGGGVIGGGNSYAGEPESYAFENQQAIRVSYGATPAPGALVIGSVGELKAYLARFGAVPGMGGLLKTYTAGFFASHRLLCVVVESGSGSNRYEIDGLLRDTVIVRATVPEIGTDDMAAWLLVAEVDTMFDGGDMPEVVIIH